MEVQRDSGVLGNKEEGRRRRAEGSTAAELNFSSVAHKSIPKEREKSGLGRRRDTL